MGGRYRIQIKDPDGDLHTASGLYREIKPPERLVFTWAWEGASGCGGQVVSGQWETVVTIELRPVPEGTELVLTQQPFPTVEDRDSHDEGWTGCLNRLATLAEPWADRPS